MTTARFEVVLTEADLVAAFRLHARLERARPLLLAAALLAEILVILLLFSPQARHSATTRPLTLLLEGALAIVLALVIALALAIRPLRRWQARRTLAQRQDLAGTTKLEVGEDGIRHETCYSQSSYPWSAIHEWREDDEIVLLYIASQLFYMVPKRIADPGQIALLRGALEAAGVRKG